MHFHTRLPVRRHLSKLMTRAGTYTFPSTPICHPTAGWPRSKRPAARTRRAS